MSFTRGLHGPRPSPYSPTARAKVAYTEERRALAPATLGEGTLACARCDAPVAIGPDVLTPSAPLRCPYCGHRGLLREFLSLARPSRPARVLVRVRRRP